MVAQSPPKNPTLAAALSFFINGLGQIYNGEIAKGIIIIVVQIVNAILMSVIIGFITWPVVWIWSIYDAYKVAQRINEQALQQVVATMKVCPRCAERVNTGAQVCHFCGYEFIPGANQLATPGQIQPPMAATPEAVVNRLPSATGPMLAATAQPTIAPTARYCPSCGKPADATARFCMSCGSSLAQPTPTAVTGVTEQQPPEVAPPELPTSQKLAEVEQIALDAETPQDMVDAVAPADPLIDLADQPAQA